MSERNASQTVSGWMAVLDRIERSLRESLAAVPEPPAEVAPGPGAAAAALQALDARLGRWQNRLAQAAQVAGQAEQLALEEEAALRRWASQLAEARQRLAGPPKKHG
jgi:hypothetical protein